MRQAGEYEATICAVVIRERRLKTGLQFFLARSDPLTRNPTICYQYVYLSTLVPDLDWALASALSVLSG